MALRRIIVFTVILLMLAAAPVWENSTGIPDLPRVDDTVTIDRSLDDANLDSLTITDRTLFPKIGYAWMP